MWLCVSPRPRISVSGRFLGEPHRSCVASGYRFFRGLTENRRRRPARRALRSAEGHRGWPAGGRPLLYSPPTLAALEPGGDMAQGGGRCPASPSPTSQLSSASVAG